MSVIAQPKRLQMTREEFERLPEGPPFYDYVDGEAVEVNRPTGRHQQIVFRLASFLWEHAHAGGLGDVFSDIDVELPNGNVYGPDVVFLSKEHFDRYDEETGDIRGAPDLVVEVLSASTAAYDRVEKFREYHGAGVAWVWFVDQVSLAVEECQWTPDGYLWLGAAGFGQVFRPRLFPGLEINLKELIGAA
jgi:Uma2 family endonuclease